MLATSILDSRMPIPLKANLQDDGKVIVHYDKKGKIASIEIGDITNL